MINQKAAIFFEHIEPIIKQAGAILLAYFKTSLDVHTKGDSSIVTQADLASESYLKSALKKIMPDASFYAEESGREGDNPYCFVIDPLDGTTNFSRGIGYFCISICLTYHDEPLAAAVYQPIQDDFFVAVKGGGTFLNGKQINLAKPHFEQSLVVISLPYKKNAQHALLLEYAQRVAPHTYAFRCMGASALDLAYVAVGRIDGICLADHAWWDVAAGILLITEAGGAITDFSGIELRSTFKNCIAGSKKVYNTLKEMLNGFK